MAMFIIALILLAPYILAVFAGKKYGIYIENKNGSRFFAIVSGLALYYLIAQLAGGWAYGAVFGLGILVALSANVGLVQLLNSLETPLLVLKCAAPLITLALLSLRPRIKVISETKGYLVWMILVILAAIILLAFTIFSTIFLRNLQNKILHSSKEEGYNMYLNWSKNR